VGSRPSKACPSQAVNIRIMRERPFQPFRLGMCGERCSLSIQFDRSCPLRARNPFRALLSTIARERSQEFDLDRRTSRDLHGGVMFCRKLMQSRRLLWKEQTMRQQKGWVLVAVVSLSLCVNLRAQELDSGSESANVVAVTSPPALGKTSGTVPRIIQFSGTIKGQATQATKDTPAETGRAGPSRVMFSLYELQDGGSPLWTEWQNVQLDDRGRYTVLLGATESNGLPVDLFSSGRALWLGVQPQLPEAPEQPRVLLVAVPYALKAVDADTLGGKPVSAFVTVDSLPVININSFANPSADDLAGVKTLPQYAGLPAGSLPCLALTSDVTATANQVAKSTSACIRENSVLFESGGSVGIGNPRPSATLDVSGSTLVRGAFGLPPTGTATRSTGYNSNSQNLSASAFNSSTQAAVGEYFRWQVEPVGNNTSAPSGTLNLLFASGNSMPSETGLSVASNGRITFAPGQTFPGGGTVTSVATGAGLTGGPITTSGTIAISNGGVSDTNLADSYSGTGPCPSNAFVTGLSRNAPPICVQPSFANLSGNASAGQLPPASNSTQGILQLGGDLRGDSTSQTVVGLRGNSLSSATPGSSNQFLGWTGSQWAPARPSFSNLSGAAADAQLAGAYSGMGSCAANQFVNKLSRNAAPSCATAVKSSTAPSHQYATRLSPSGALTYAQPLFSDLSGVAAVSQLPAASGSSQGILRLAKDLRGTAAAPLVAGLRGYPVSNTAPTTGQVLQWNGSAWAPATLSGGISGVSGTSGMLPEWKGAATLGNSPLTDAAGSLTSTEPISAPSLSTSGSSAGVVQLSSGAVSVDWTLGSGAPTGKCLVGSLFSRTDGGVGSTLYVCEGPTGTWAAK
jgi:hypothetical protein